MRRHTYRILAATTSAFAIAGMLAAPAAWAEPVNPVACEQASAALAAVPAPVGVPSDLEQKAAQAQQAITEGESRIAELQKVIDTNQAFLDAPETAESAKPYFQGQVDAATADLAAEETVQAGLVTAYDAAADALAADQARFTAEQQAVADAEAAQTEACVEAEAPATTEPPEATETPESTEQPGASTDPADNPVVDGDDEQAATATESDATALYENCAAVRDAGKAPLFATDPGYRAGLDSDGDGVACETGTLYNPSGNGENPSDYSQTGDVPVGSAETGQA